MFKNCAERRRSNSRSNGIATLTTILIIAGAFAAGFIALKLTGKNDSAFEQIAESVLEEHGIDYDFSDDDDDEDKQQDVVQEYEKKRR